ncbi:hypothetical protein LTV02_04965 [Nocardia yamanashiensis]|uniref:hypothetical protein n=1 Tax=Nocardia yamanashiensis TaxID=209247 RepID=UPI001E39D5DA|nr:hypothetical protein [Nocardia yamanashiensis]UGT42767.1 hypothetical protein LTV02_04965 [Nocardia yamanashiensis]
MGKLRALTVRLGASIAVTLIVAACSASHSASSAPADNAPIAELLTWIQSGTPTDTTTYRLKSSDIDAPDAAFTTPDRKTSCWVQLTRHPADALACTTDFQHPEPAPTAASWDRNPAPWQPNYVELHDVDFSIGSGSRPQSHTGPVLPYGSKFEDGDYVCRIDRSTGTYCVNTLAHTGIRISESGVHSFGCPRELATDNITYYTGLRYNCDRTTTPPAPAAPIIDYVNAGIPVDATAFRPLRGDTLPQDIIFTDPTHTIRCATEFHLAPTLSCQYAFQSTPARPEITKGSQWIANWIAYDTTTLTLGSQHGDPGPFIAAVDPEVLPYGNTITFADRACRLDPTALTCIDKKAATAFKATPEALIPYGCLVELQHGSNSRVGQEFHC